MDAGQVRELLQRRVLLRPPPFEGSDGVILTLSDAGAVLEVRTPQAAPATPGRGGETAAGTPADQVLRPPASNRRPGMRRAPAAAAAADAGSSGGGAGKAADGVLGPCPLCGAAVVEQDRSYGCSGWRGGCKFAIWKTIAGKKLSARTAQALLRRGHQPAAQGVQVEGGEALRGAVEAGERRGPLRVRIVRPGSFPMRLPTFERFYGVDFSGAKKAGDFIWVAEVLPVRAPAALLTCGSPPSRTPLSDPRLATTGESLPTRTRLSDGRRFEDAARTGPPSNRRGIKKVRLTTCPLFRRHLPNAEGSTGGCLAGKERGLVVELTRAVSARLSGFASLTSSPSCDQFVHQFVQLLSLWPSTGSRPRHPGRKPSARRGRSSSW